MRSNFRMFMAGFPVVTVVVLLIRAMTLFFMAIRMALATIPALTVFVLAFMAAVFFMAAMATHVKGETRNYTETPPVKSA